MKKSMKEVVRIVTQLKEFMEQDAGFAQFVERHGIVSATPEIRKAYRRWEYEIVLEKLEEERLAAEQAEMLAISRKEGMEKGRAELNMEFALNILKMRGNKTNTIMLDDEMQSYGIPREIIQAARKQYEESQEHN